MHANTSNVNWSFRFPCLDDIKLSVSLLERTMCIFRLFVILGIRVLWRLSLSFVHTSQSVWSMNISADGCCCCTLLELFVSRPHNSPPPPTHTLHNQIAEMPKKKRTGKIISNMELVSFFRLYSFISSDGNQNN